ncbi:MAG TPA: hypothetical protein VIY50_06625 [Steroidobacteraceae bacterium]
MPARWKVGLALLALATAGQLRAEPLAPHVAISRCIAQADAKLHGIAALNQACPGVRSALDQLRLTGFLPADWQKTLTTGGLADVSQLVQRYAGSPASGLPKVAALRSIAAGLVPQQPPPTWWDRITVRIRRWMNPFLQPITHWLRSLGPALRNPRRAPAIFYGLSALLLITAVAVLAFELRATGPIRRRRKALRSHQRHIAANGPESVAARSAEPDWTRLREQPARLLRLLVETLTRAHRLERDRHLTCRQLEVEARFETELEREGFVRLARLAERELYGPPGAMILSDDILRAAQMLHERLLAVTGEGREVRQ